MIAHLVIGNIVKSNLANSACSISPEYSPLIQTYQSFQHQFNREASMLAAKRSKEGLTFKSAKQFYFQRVLETLRCLRDKYFE